MDLQTPPKLEEYYVNGVKYQYLPLLDSKVHNSSTMLRAIHGKIHT